MKETILAFMAVIVSLAAPLDYTPRVLQRETSPDGKYVVEVADYTRRLQFELWSTNVQSGVRIKIGHLIPFDNDVSEFLISNTSQTVVYRQGRTATGDWLLYTTPIYGQTGSSGIRICQPMVLGGSVEPGIRKIWDGTYVEYVADPFVDEQYHTYVVRMTGGRINELIFADGFENGNAGRWR